MDDKDFQTEMKKLGGEFAQDIEDSFEELTLNQKSIVMTALIDRFKIALHEVKVQITERDSDG